MKSIGIIAILWTLCFSFARPQTETNERIGIDEVLDELVTNAEKEIVPAAQAMPEEKYAFAPVNGEFKGVRTFAEQVKHLAAANYQLAARILGEAPPHNERNESAPGFDKNKRRDS